MELRPREVARACETWYDTKLRERLQNQTWIIDAAVQRQNPLTRYQRARSEALSPLSAHGGVAVLLRGGAFRGSGTLAARRAAQVECVSSVERQLIRPLVKLGYRVGAFLTMYDDDIRDPSMLDELRRPLEEHLELVTVLSSGASDQILSLLAAVNALLDHCRRTGAIYTTVVVTRFDLRFKMSLVNLSRWRNSIISSQESMLLFSKLMNLRSLKCVLGIL